MSDTPVKRPAGKGGARPGAGRPSQGRTTNINVKSTPDMKSKLIRLTEVSGMSQADIIEDWIRSDPAQAETVHVPGMRSVAKMHVQIYSGLGSFS